MNTNSSQTIRREYTAKIVLTAVFLLLFAAFVYWRTGQGQRLEAFQFGPFDLALLALATFRLGRLVAYDVVMEPLRRPFARTVPDSTGAGESVEARGEGAQRALGQLISCPICAGTWVAALLVYALATFPGPARIFLIMTAAVGAAEILNAVVEALCWSGQLSRVLAGEKSAARYRQPLPADEFDPESYPAALREKKLNGSPRQDY
jgi:hypothetical protein